MGLNRMNGSVVANRVAATKPKLYIFTLDPLYACKYLGDGELILAGRFVEPATAFPTWVMRNIDYAVARGVDVRVTEYTTMHHNPVGVMMELLTTKHLGCYAAKYAAILRAADARTA